MFSIKSRLIFTALITSLTTTLFFGCSDDQQQAQQVRKSQVKAMKVIQRDTPLTSEFAGQILAANEVKVQSKVTGNVVEKYVTGGQFVSVDQPLYKIDSRTYESAVLKARADLAQSEATLKNAQIDLYRDQKLLEDAAIAEQVVTTQEAQVRAYEAQAAANEALLKTALENLADTMIYAPMSGQLSVDDVAVGTFVTAGQTNLVTIGTTNPIFASNSSMFSLSNLRIWRLMSLSPSLTALSTHLLGRLSNQIVKWLTTPVLLQSKLSSLIPVVSLCLVCLLASSSPATLVQTQYLYLSAQFSNFLASLL